MPVDPRGRRATRIAKLALDVTWGLGLVLAILLATVVLSAPRLERAGLVARFDWNAFQVHEGTGPPALRLKVSLPDDAASTQPTLTSSDPVRASDPTLEREGDTYLVFRTRRWGFLYAANALLLPLLAAALIGVRLLRSFLADVLAADVFTPRNANRLSTLGWLLIALGVAAPHLEHWRAWMILKRIELEGAALSPHNSPASGLWLVGVLVLVVAAAWRYGAELQQERDLTV